MKKECCAQTFVKSKTTTNSLKAAQKLEHFSVLLFLSFLFLSILSYDYKQGRAVMSDAADILKSVQIGLNLVTFLLNTDRGLQATELSNECVILLQNLYSGSHLDISDVLFNAYYAISGYTDAERYATKLLHTLHHVGRLTIKLGARCQVQSRFVEAKQLYKCALNICKTVGHKREEAVALQRLGNVCISLSEYQKAKEYHEKALAIAIEIGDRNGEGTTYGNLGGVFHSLGEYQKAKEYHEKALAIAIEIGDRKREGTGYGNLGYVFYSLCEYQKAREYYEKALSISIEIGDRDREGTIYGNLGGVSYSHGEYQKATEYYEKALVINIEIGDRKGERRTCTGLGISFYFLSEY